MNTTIIDDIFFIILLGQKQLLQFTIGNPEFRLSNNGSLLKAVFTLHRIPSYILINTYIPSFFIMLMTIVPLYLKEDTHYATTLVLLNILCLYTVLQSSRDGIPKTAYLKFVDYWNIFALTVTLATFFILVDWEIWQHEKSNKRGKSEIKTAIRIAMPLVSIIGVIFYWIFAALLYLEYID